ncbi:MAG: triose-phosphate isomerase [Armatimonadetes bacterium]|nr:triose-phosphate isomerase [Armatimonadota bacterium]
MALKLIAGNWKMNLTPEEGLAFLSALGNVSRQDVTVALFPSFVSLAPLREAAGARNIRLGAQDVFWKPSGAFTGSVSAPMLAAVGVEYCIVGHSETRGRFGKLEIEASQLPYFSETNETCRLKMEALLANGITPILCVGETLAERESGATEATIAKQLKEGLAGIDTSKVVVAYEPVWAIGTGNTCASDEAGRVCRFIRSEVPQVKAVLYGGSVKASNAAELFAQDGIDGGLVGGASLVPDEFARIIESA